MTEQFPPYNFQDGKKLQGISVDLLEKTWENYPARHGTEKFLTLTEFPAQ